VEGLVGIVGLGEVDVGKAVVVIDALDVVGEAVISRMEPLGMPILAPPCWELVAGRSSRGFQSSVTWIAKLPSSVLGVTST